MSTDPTGPGTFCTIVARNYLAHARVLAASLARFDPDAELAVLVLDDVNREVGAGESFRVVHPDEIMDRRSFLELATAYTTLELATALKPALLRHELASAKAVVYLDPDIQVFDGLGDIVDLAVEAGVVLTPHCIRPVPRDGKTPDEAVFLRAGTFNLGFIAVGPSAKPLLDWWDERLRLDCVHAVDEGLFVDQKWIDLAVGHFDFHLVDHVGCNVAYWNLHERPVRAEGDRYRVEDVPLRFFHFSGFDPDVPHRLSKHGGARPRVLLSDVPDVRRLCTDYAAELRLHGYDTARQVPYEYARTALGLPLDHRMRRMYLAALREQDGQAPPPPFDAAGAGEFLEWLREPAIAGATGDVSRYAMRIWDERPDVRFHFGDLYGVDSGRFVEWLQRPDIPETVSLPEPLIPQKPPAPRFGRPEIDELKPGVTVVGYVRTESGVGEGARALVAALDAAEIDCSVVPYTDTPNRSRHPYRGRGDAAHAVTVTCINADETPRFARRLGDQVLDGRWRVGMWAWEVDVFPAEYATAADHVDEIWVGSAHTARAVASATDKPVHVLPLPISVEQPPPSRRADLDLPEGFLALFCFDFASVPGRKNPEAVIEAFRAAFDDGDESVRLVVKTVGGERYPEELERLRLAASADRRVRVMDGYVTRDEHLALVAACDVYVSLHRAEGFGLTMAEAMALGRPVVATGYSGNLEFMDESTAWLVPYELVPVGEGHAPYPPNATWADPDVEAAARAIREIRDDPAAALARAEAGRRAIEERHSPAARAEFLRTRVAAGEAQWRKRRDAAVAVRRATEGGPAPIEAPLRALIGAGPDPGAPSKYGAVSRTVRKAANRAIAGYAGHQRRIDELVADTIEAVDAQRIAHDEALHQAIADLAARLTDLAADVDKVADHAASRAGRAEARIAELADELSAEPYRTRPGAFRVRDEQGRTTLGYDADGMPAEAAYDWFVDGFRGPEALVTEALRAYVPTLRDCAPVLEIGPGRGELLSVLREEGVEARGVELDPVLAARCVERGLDVVAGDGLAALRSLPPGSLGAVVAIEVIEHLPTEQRDELVAAARAAPRPGGGQQLETVNPHSARALKTFWLDPTHVRPLYPEGMLVTCRAHGFASARITFVDGTGDLDRDRTRCGSYAVVAVVP